MSNLILSERQAVEVWVTCSWRDLLIKDLAEIKGDPAIAVAKIEARIASMDAHLQTIAEKAKRSE
jgi:hypothetical protein